MTESTKVLASQFLAPKEFEAFESSFDSLIEEYRNSGTLKLDSLVPILGKPPIIPQSPDTDAMLEAYDEKAIYGHKIKEIESLLKLELEKK